MMSCQELGIISCTAENTDYVVYTIITYKATVKIDKLFII